MAKTELERLVDELNALNKEAVQAVAEYNTALQGNDAVNIAKCEAKAKAAVEALNEKKVAHTYETWYQAEDPMDAAIRQAYISQYSIKVTENKDTRAKSATLEGDARQVVMNLAAFTSRSAKAIVPNGQWVYLSERVCMMFNRLATERINGDLKRFDSKYRVRKEALGLNVDADLSSNTSKVKVIQNIVDMILFKEMEGGKNQYKVLNCDVNFILECLTREGRGQNIVLAKPTTFNRLIVKMLHRIVTEGRYDALYAEKRD